MNIVTISENKAILNNDELNSLLVNYSLEVMSDFESDTAITLDKPASTLDVIIALGEAAELSNAPELAPTLQKKCAQLAEDLRRNLNSFLYSEIKPIH